MHPCLRALVVTLALLAATPPGRAGEIARLTRLADAVPDGGGRTWADLAALVFPGLKSQAEIRRIAEAASPPGTFSEPVYLPDRYVAGTISALRPLAARFFLPEKMPERFYQDGVAFVRIKGDGKPLLAGLFASGGDIAALALFEEGAQGRLLDLVNVSSDRNSQLLARPALPLGLLADALVIVNSHDSHTVAMEEYTLIFVRDGRFAEIGGVATGQSFYDCASQHRQSVAFRTRPDAGSPYARIVAVQTTIDQTRPDDCETRRYKPVVETLKAQEEWRWDGASQAWVGVGELGAVEGWRELGWHRAGGRY